jgi:hypothetical protein
VTTTTLFLSAFCTFLVGGGLFLTRKPLAMTPSALLTSVLPGVALAHVGRTVFRSVSWTPFATNIMLVAIMAIWVTAACVFVQEVHRANRAAEKTV